MSDFEVRGGLKYILALGEEGGLTGFNHPTKRFSTRRTPVLKFFSEGVCMKMLERAGSMIVTILPCCIIH